MMTEDKMLSTRVNLDAYDLVTKIKFRLSKPNNPVYKKYILEEAIIDFAKKVGVK